MKYNYSLAKPIKQFIEWELEHYPDRCARLEDLRQCYMPRITATIDGQGHGGARADSTADAAMRIATDEYIQNTERKVNAIKRVLKALDETDSELVKIKYWARTHTVEGAAQLTNVSVSTAYYRINRILCAIAAEMGETES